MTYFEILNLSSIEGIPYKKFLEIKWAWTPNALYGRKERRFVTNVYFF